MRRGGNTQEGGAALAMKHVPPEIVERICRIRQRDPSAPVMQQFGISDNSWRKLRRGEPLRRSVADRLIARFSCDRMDQELSL